MNAKTGYVYAVASGKGGVGTTTTAVHLGAAIRRENGRVAVVDADLAMPNLADHVGINPEITLHDVLAGEAEPTAAVFELDDGLAVVPGDRSLAAFRDADPAQLGTVVDELRATSDFVIIDTGAGMSQEDLLPLGLADEVILVTTDEAAAVVDTKKVASFAELLGRPVGGIVVTRASTADAEAAIETLDTDLLAAIPEDDAVTAAIRGGMLLEVHAPESPSAAAYDELAATLLDRRRRAEVDGEG